MTELEQKLRTVAALRKAKADTQETLQAVQAQINATPLGERLSELYSALRDINERLGAQETEARLEAVQAFHQTGERKPVPGAEVKMFTTVKITDPAQAMRWAIDHAPSTITLNETKFGSAVSALSLPFITVGEEPRGQISSDLSKWLE
jgi:hypothetical protein